MTTYTEWYNNKSVLFEMVPYLQRREMTMKRYVDGIMIRYIRATNTDGIQYWLNRMNAHETNYNIYTSMAEFNEQVPFRHGPTEGHDKNYWDKYWEQIKKYDLLVDIDMDSWNDEEVESAIYTADTLKTYFDKNNVPYEFIHSGKGFHFVIPEESFKFEQIEYNPWKDGNIYQKYTKVLNTLNRKHSDMIDTKIADARRVRKIPFSLAIYEDGVSVCFPINTPQLWADVMIDYHKIREPDHWKGKIFKHGRFTWNKGGVSSCLREMM